MVVTLRHLAWWQSEEYQALLKAPSKETSQMTDDRDETEYVEMEDSEAAPPSPDELASRNKGEDVPQTAGGGPGSAEGGAAAGDAGAGDSGGGGASQAGGTGNAGAGEGGGATGGTTSGN